MKRVILILLTIFLHKISVHSQLVSNAGENFHFCTYPDSINSLIVGGVPGATGGVPPYTFSWSISPLELYEGSDIVLHASDILDDTTISNPNILDFTLNDTLIFYLKVTDSQGNESFDTTIITISAFVKELLYYDYSINVSDSIFLDKGTNISSLFDNSNNLTFLWTPSASLSNPNIGNYIWAKPSISTWYSVLITDSFGCAAQGDPYYYINVNSVGFTDNACESYFRISPNPANEYLYIQNLENYEIDEIKIIDMTGKAVMSSSCNIEKFIDISEIENGLYILLLLYEKNKIFESQIIIE